MPIVASGGRDADADEQPRPRRRRTPAGPRRLRRDGEGGAVVGGVRRDRADAPNPRRRRDDARAVGQAGRRLPDPRDGAARVDLELDARAEVGDVGHVPRARARRADDVRADDRGLVDLHRDPGDPAGNVRDLRRGGDAAVRRVARRDGHAHRRARRDGRRAAARRDDERGRRPLRRDRPGAHRAAHQDAVPRPRDRRPRRGAAVGGRGAFGRARRSRSGSSATAPRSCPSCSRAGSRPNS